MGITSFGLECGDRSLSLVVLWFCAGRAKKVELVADAGEDGADFVR